MPISRSNLAGLRALRWRDFCPPRGCFHVNRATYQAGDPLNDHRQDFAEVFWMERGAGWHLVNGAKVRLEVGDVVLVRTSDRHGFRADRGGMVFVNVAFAGRELTELQRRYFARQSTWPWKGGKLPTHRRVSAGELERLGRWADGVSMNQQTRLQLHAFLLDLLQMLVGDLTHSRLPRHATVPPWLQLALSRMEQPDHLREGLPALVRLGQRSPEHLNRTLRRCTGQTATQAVNRLRLDLAARLLRMSSLSIAAIAVDCGVENLGYFYRLFEQQFGTTPRQYRLRQQALT